MIFSNIRIVIEKTKDSEFYNKKLNLQIIFIIAINYLLTFNQSFNYTDHLYFT